MIPRVQVKPQQLVFLDLHVFQRLVDNMSFFMGDDGKKYNLFGSGGVKKTAEEFQKEFLGEIPIYQDVGKHGDQGKPIVEALPEHEVSKIYISFAEKLKRIYKV